MPPGVEIKVGERWVQKDLTSYLEKGRRTVTVEGPLGVFFPFPPPPFSFFLLAFLLVSGHKPGHLVLRIENGRVWMCLDCRIKA